MTVYVLNDTSLFSSVTVHRIIEVADDPGANVAVSVVVEDVAVVVNVGVPNNNDAVPAMMPVVGSGSGVTDGENDHTYVFLPILPPVVTQVNERVCD